ncbi:MAG: hypothetical protein BZY80_05695 [SAR202 cluster bacterium Io17-Chloro-G2]|nr:MAG: hypothetical protein BZY80_05695 [SAR202 cluster bacterium Io17-Chloro-G2]
MTAGDAGQTLLALDAGVRETGWAVFGPLAIPGVRNIAASGVIKAPAPRKADVQTRVTHLTACLDRLVDEWAPLAVVHSRPSGIHWPVPALELLEHALAQWSRRHNLPLHAYTAQEVRSAIAGQPNASQDQLAFAVMERLGLIGQSKTSHEWEALAVGEHHLGQSMPAPAPSPPDRR